MIYLCDDKCLLWVWVDDVLFWWNLSSVWVEMVLSWIVPRCLGVESSPVRGRNILYHYTTARQT